MRVGKKVLAVLYINTYIPLKGGDPVNRSNWTEQAKQHIIACLNSDRLSDATIRQIMAIIMLNVNGDEQAKAELAKLVR